MDVHRDFVQLAVLEDGLLRDEGRIGVTPEALRARPTGFGGLIKWRRKPPATATQSPTC
jgi:hypothetical protein